MTISITNLGIKHCRIHDIFLKPKCNDFQIDSETPTTDRINGCWNCRFSEYKR